MARDLIQIHRGFKENLPNLVQGEQAYTLDTNELYIGGLGGNVLLSGIKNVTDVTSFGAIGDGITDDTEAINNAIQNGNVIYFPNKVYKVSDQLTFKHGQSIFAPNGVKFDGAGFIGTNGNIVLKVENDGADYWALPSITADINKGDLTITFSSPHNLSEGDIICLYDNTEYSWSSSRPYYKKAEFARVDRVISSNEIEIDNPTFDTYLSLNVNFGVYKMNMGTFSIIGDVEVYNDLSNGYGMMFERLKDFDFTGLKSIIDNGTHSMYFNQCFNGKLNCTAIQKSPTIQGLDYGLSIGNCQHMIIDGYFKGERHGITHGGSDGVGAIIVRDINVRGVAKNSTGGNGVNAFDCHGNTEFVRFDGTMLGGCNLGGKSHKISGVINVGNEGIAVYMSEVAKFDFDFSNLKIFSSGDPKVVGRAVFDFGGNSTADVDNMEGGIFNLQGVQITAPNASNGVNFRMRNANVDVNTKRIINMSNMKIDVSTSADVSYLIQDVAGVKDYDLVNLSGMVYSKKTVNLLNVKQVINDEKNGVESIVLNTGVNFISQQVLYDEEYPSAIKPIISLSSQDNVIQGGNIVVVGVGNVSNTGFFIVLTTNDGTNFQTTNTLDITWKAQ